MNGTNNGVQMPIEEFVRQARLHMTYMSADDQVTTLIHLIYHTLDDVEQQEQFIVGLITMKGFDFNT